MLICTAGDPYSVNIEALNRVLRSGPGPECFPGPVVICGSHWHWQEQTERLFGTPLLQGMREISSLKQARGRQGFFFLDTGGAERPAEDLTDLERGRIAVEALKILKTCPVDDKLAVLTAPVNKHVCRSYGFHYPGQTEFFEDLWGQPAVMILAGSRLKVGLVTTHVPVAELAGAINQEKVISKAGLFLRALKDSFGIRSPRVGICGLNPHCGENGTCGREELEIIEPAVEKIRLENPDCQVEGPLPADTVFWSACQGNYDGVLAMYHDQGLGPLKTVHFYNAVNLSGGLPHLRVSPDHGPASDLFLKNKVRTDSFREAYDTCLRYLNYNL